MGRHAAPGPPDRPTPGRPDPAAAAPEQLAASGPDGPAAPEPTRPDQPEPEVPRDTTAPRPAGPPPSSAGPTASPGTPIGFLASLVLGAVVGLAAGGVLWWAGRPLGVAGAVAGGVLLVVVLAAWVARGVAARHPLQ